MRSIRFPHAARLAAALLCAAASGPRAEQDGELLRPCEADMAALRWLETHPPDGVRVPPLSVNQPDGLAYRIRLLETCGMGGSSPEHRNRWGQSR